MAGKEKAYLVGIQRPTESRPQAERSLFELVELTRTAGGEIVGQTLQSIKQIDSTYFIGSGKVQEIARFVEEKTVDLVIIDDDLSPAQQAHLENKIGIRIVDRTGLILDIFAQRARSRAGKLQVELAQMIYLLPRLKGRGVLMSRLGGGIGTRGPGETKLEVDRRTLRDRISKLRAEISQLQKTRHLHRSKRQGIPLPIVSLVGYTNAGKSALLNSLSGAGVLTQDMLFSTLDPTTRQIFLPNKQKFLLTDTVGFIKKLPVQLIDAFKATLEEVTESDLICHLVDLSDSEFETKMKVVDEILHSLGAGGRSILYVYNKIDKVEDPRLIFLRHKRRHPFVMISAEKKINLWTGGTTAGTAGSFLEQIEAQLSHFTETVELKIPIEDQKAIADIFAWGQVLEQHYFRRSVRIKATLSHRMANQFKKIYG